jgi:hypothetical protein
VGWTPVDEPNDAAYCRDVHLAVRQIMKYGSYLAKDKVVLFETGGVVYARMAKFFCTNGRYSFNGNMIVVDAILRN